MAVARPELTTGEIKWVVEVLEQAPLPPGPPKRAMRELRRAKERALAMERREVAHTRALRREAAVLQEHRQERAGADAL